MGRKDLDRARKKLQKLERTLSDFVEKFNKEYKEAMSIIDEELKVEATTKRGRTPRRKAVNGGGDDDDD